MRLEFCNSQLPNPSSSRVERGFARLGVGRSTAVGNCDSLTIAALFVVVLLAPGLALAQPPAGAQGAGAAGQPPAPGRGRGAPAPETRIISFEARPATIRAGESAVLSWVIENPPSATGFGGFGTIDQGVGRVVPRGTVRVTPRATTTYTLSAGSVTKTVTVTIPGTTPVAAGAASAASATNAGIPRTPDGKPDFSGVYGWANLFAGPGGGGRAGGAGAPAGPTLKPGAEKYRVTRGPLDTGATSDCMPLIPPNSFGVPYEFQIIQNKDYVVIFHEYPGSFRIVPFDEPHMVDPDPAWLGDSVGKWDGNTLVIDTIGYNDKTEINGFHHTEDLHTVERLTRVDGGIDYELTIEDPNVFAAPWKLTRQFRVADPPRKRIFEFVCENNRDYRPLFGDKK